MEDSRFCFGSLSFFEALLLLGARLGAGTLILFVFYGGRFTIIYLLGAILQIKVSQNEFLTAMQRTKLPQSMILATSIALRYLPTMHIETRFIVESLKLRNLAPSFRNILIHPIRTMEVFFVPLLMHSIKIADELAAAALCKGANCPDKRSTVSVVKIKFVDMCIILFAVGGTVALAVL